jgi:Trypsin-like peptidase domain
MRGRTRSVLVFLLLLSAQSRAETVCVDLGQLAHSTVSITRYFEDAERNPQSDVVAARGTAWFQSPTTLVTAAHVTSGMKLSTQEWKSVSIKDGAEGQSNAVRMQRVVGSYAEKLAVLELQTAVPDARSVAIRMLPLMPEDRVVTVAYPNDRLNTVVGRFVQYADTGRLAGTALLEIFEGENRLVIDYGASGAPVFDCEGRVAAVISTVITQILSTPFGNRRVSTAWGSPNVVSIPIQQLIEFSKAQ